MDSEIKQYLFIYWFDFLFFSFDDDWLTILYKIDFRNKREKKHSKKIKNTLSDSICLTALASRFFYLTMNFFHLSIHLVSDVNEKKCAGKIFFVKNTLSGFTVPIDWMINDAKKAKEEIWFKQWISKSINNNW